MTGRQTKRMSEDQAVREERRRLQDARRNSYGEAVAWLIGLRDDVQSIIVFQKAIVGSPGQEGMRQTGNERWAAALEKVSVGLPEAMKPLLRVASDIVIESYKRIIATITFWPTSFQPGTVTTDLTSDLADLEGEALMNELQKRWRPVTREELDRMKLDSATHYLSVLDAFIHLLRKEVGLTTAQDVAYLSPEPVIPQSVDDPQPRKLFRFGQ